MAGKAESSSSYGFDKTLENLFKNRFHGAANIRGIRYQILYTVFRALDLLDKNSTIQTIRAEGIEDVDLQGLSTGFEFIQVKYSQKPWNWAKLKEPIENFFQAYNENGNTNFILVVNFELQKDFRKLADLKTLPLRERQRIEKKYRQLCINAGFPRENFPDFISRFKIISLTEMQIIEELRRKLANNFELTGETVDIYISVFMANFLNWADNRIAITISELKELHFIIQETLSEEEFNAYGRGLIKRICWDVDKRTDDFFDGKKTRPGHIVCGLDVKRPKWLDRIDSAVRASKICIIRSSSGQGKSTLMFRFAYEKWSEDNIYIIKTAETPEHVEQIRNYLKIRADLGIPILVLIDDTGWQLRLWSYILKDCAALGINALLTIRNEDWFRFATQSLTGYEVIEPSLDMEEAKDIYRQFNVQSKVHSSVTSAEWAYEKIGKPRLLMEYTYLLTHGRMLEDRLRDQIKEFLKLKEEPAKIEILRKISISDSLGTPISLEKLMKKVEMKSDPQSTLESLIGEYLTIESGNISGLHWVRSNHLFKILHENFLNPAQTALETIEMIPEEMVSVFVSNAIARKEFDSDTFINGLLEKSSNESLRHILSYIEGIFEAGERIYFEVNRDLFDEGFDFLGKAGISLLSSEFLPIIKPNTLDRMLEITEGEQAVNFKKLKEIMKKARVHNRGLDLSRNFIEKLFLQINPVALHEEPGQTGKLLDWCFLCKSPLPFWAKIRGILFSEKNLFDLPFEEFCQFAIGLYRQNEQDYRKWYLDQKETLLSYLKLHTGCIELSVSEEKLYIEFLPEFENETTLNDQAVNRLTKLRTAIPFCQRYQSKSLWFLPNGLTPSVDDSQKNMPRENLHIESDINKNVVWSKIVENYYLPDSYYKYQMSWYNLRKDVLVYFSDFSQGLKGLLEGKENVLKESVTDGKLSAKIFSQLTIKPDPPQQTSKHLCDLHREGPARWASHLENFFSFLFRYFNGSNDKDTKRFIVHNFKESLKHLLVVHESFKNFFKISPDYFDAASLESEEKKKYDLFADLLDIWLINPINQFQKNMLAYIKGIKDRKRELMIKNVKEALRPLDDIGVEVILPFDSYYNHPLRYFPIAYSVLKPTEAFEEMYQLLLELKSVKEVAQFFWIIPIHKGHRFGNEGYCLSSNRLDELCEGNTDNWESLVPRKVPNEILSLLPAIPLKVDNKLKIRNEIYGLVGAIPMLITINSYAQRLIGSQNPYEKKLYNKYRVKLVNAVEELVKASSKIETEFEREFPQKSKTFEYQTIIQFIQKIRCSHEQDSFVNFLDEIQSNGEEITESVDHLLDEAYEQ